MLNVAKGSRVDCLLTEEKAMVLSGHQSSLGTFNRESFDSSWNFPTKTICKTSKTKQYVKEVKMKTKEVLPEACGITVNSIYSIRAKDDFELCQNAC